MTIRLFSLVVQLNSQPVSCSDYNPKDRVNPEAQLDPKSGKSIEATKKEHEQRLIRPEEQWPTYNKETTQFHNGFKVVKLKE